MSDVRSIKADSFKVALDMTKATLEEKAPLEAPVRPLEETLDIAGFIFEAEAATAGEDGKVRDLRDVICQCCRVVPGSSKT